MTLCNVCRAPLPERDQVGFLCTHHVLLAPPKLMKRYDKAVKAIRAYRRANEGAISEDLALRIYRAWKTASEAARAAHARMQGAAT